ncbi:MAG: DUF1566 domain-containing protein [Desulfuromonadales bacterium]
MKNRLLSLLLFTVLTSFFTLRPSHAATPPSLLPQTGQTTCYDTAGTLIACAGTGQDGELTMGLAWPIPRFLDNGDQTVTDRLTGLIWAKDAHPAAVSKSWQQALDYIKSLNSSKYLGYSDWRLPNVNELLSLIHKGQTYLSWLDTQGFSNVQPYGYWSGSTCPGYADYAWYVRLISGSVYTSLKGNLYDVWPVRSSPSGAFGLLTLAKTGQTACYDSGGSTISCSGTGQDGELQNGAAWPSPRFQDNTDQSVTDNVTGLIWSKNGKTPGPAVCGTGIEKTWQGALDHVKCLNSNSYLGRTDWRLPNLNELTSMINRGQDNSATWLNGQGFSNIQYAYWSGSTYAYSTFNAWYVIMNGGNVDVSIKGGYGGYYVWPVRSGQSVASITWRHQGDGKVYGMTTTGTTITGGAQFYQEANPAWTIVGQGDFDGDGIKDFVWWNSSTGQLYIMLMSSSTAVKSGAIVYTEPDSSWRIVATGDLNGDGKSDLIWWNNSTGQVYAMLLNGTAVAGGGLIYAESNTNWKIVAAADFNGNGTVELLWWNSSTGQTAIGQTNGTNASNANLIWYEPDTSWRIAGAGDLDGDGKADIIWHNRSTGQVYGMQTNGSSVTNGAMIYTEPDTNWEIVSVGNYNGDSKADLLWWNQQTGQVYLMPMNGLAVGSGGVLLYTEPDTTWHILGETEWRDNLYGRGVTTTTK